MLLICQLIEWICGYWHIGINPVMIWNNTENYNGKAYAYRNTTVYIKAKSSASFWKPQSFLIAYWIFWNKYVKGIILFSIYFAKAVIVWMMGSGFQSALYSIRVLSTLRWWIRSMTFIGKAMCEPPWWLDNLLFNLLINLLLDYSRE